MRAKCQTITSSSAETEFVVCISHSALRLDASKRVHVQDSEVVPIHASYVNIAEGPAQKSFVMIEERNEYIGQYTKQQL